MRDNKTIIGGIFMTKFITFNAQKGGVGKTAISINWAFWLAFFGAKVCLIDLDYSCNLSQHFDLYDTEGTIENVFLQNDKPVTFHTISDNLSVVQSNRSLQQINSDIQNKHNRDLILFLWIDANPEIFNKFDYVVFDTHNDFSSITKNAILVSDLLLSPIEPSEGGISAKDNLDIDFEMFQKELVDPITKRTYVQAKKLYFLNIIDNRTNASRKLVERSKSFDDIGAIMPRKQLIVDSISNKFPVVEMEHSDDSALRKHKNFYKIYNEVFQYFKDQADNVS